MSEINQGDAEVTALRKLIDDNKKISNAQLILVEQLTEALRYCADEPYSEYSCEYCRKNLEKILGEVKP
jgi:hypothetical protein